MRAARLRNHGHVMIQFPLVSCRLHLFEIEKVADAMPTLFVGIFGVSYRDVSFLVTSVVPCCFLSKNADSRLYILSY